MSKVIFFQTCLVAMYLLLIFPNLGTRGLWQDEAETALVARQMVNSNVWLPYARDEQGSISQDWNYQFSIGPLWRWHPWLQFYLTAFSFKLFGISALTARLPFAIIGIISYIYFIYFIKKYGPKSRFFQLFSLLLFLLSAPLFLHFRQCRYYAPSVLFYLITIDGYLELFNKNSHERRILSWLKYGKYLLGSIFLFHSFLPGALTLQLAFWIDLIRTVLAKQGQSFLRLRNFSFAFFSTLFFTLPWAIWLKIGGQNINFNLTLIKQHLFQHYIYIHKFIFPFFLIIPFLSAGIRKKLFKNNVLILFFIIICVNLTLYTFNHPYFFRYLIPLIPIFIFIISWILLRINKIFRIILILILFQMISRIFPEYIYEISHRYMGTSEQLIFYLDYLSNQNYQTLAVNYDDFTFRFHTKFKVFGAQQLNQILDCPDVIVIYPEWGNEARLKEIALSCGLELSPLQIPYSKLADDPNPVTHLFRSPDKGKISLFIRPLHKFARSL